MEDLKEKINKLIDRETEFIHKASEEKKSDLAVGIAKHKFHTAKKGMALEILKLVEANV